MNSPDLNQVYSKNYKKHSLTGDWNRDEKLDKSVLVFSEKPEGYSHGLYIFLDEKLDIYKEGFKWAGSTDDYDSITLDKNRKGSLEIDMRDSNIRKRITVAFRDDNFVVAGYLKKRDSKRVCDINFLTGEYHLNGQIFFQDGYDLLKDWHVIHLPEECH